MSQRIRVDTELLAKLADEIHNLAVELNGVGNGLVSGILGCTEHTEFIQLRTSARKDAYEARQQIAGVERGLSENADRLLALSRAFRSVDEETITYLTGLLGDSWLRQVYPGPQYPDLDGFEPYYSPQTCMALTDWAVMYDSSLVKSLHIYTTGQFIENVVGVYTNPKGKRYFVADLGDGNFGFIPADRASDPLDFSKVPDREGDFFNGQKERNPDLLPPWNAEWPTGSDWHTEGDPWQNLIIGNMNVTGINNEGFRTTAHANLCGELSVLFAVGEKDLEAGLSRFAKLEKLGYWDAGKGEMVYYSGTQVLKDGSHTTSSYDLTRTFAEYGWESTTSGGEMATPEELAGKIESGHKLIFLTELNTQRQIYSAEAKSMIPNHTYGQLVPGAPKNTSGRAAHWVTVTDVFQDDGGDVFVKVFNTYSGCEETYSWETFVKTCEQPGNQEGKYTYIEAWKPSPDNDPIQQLVK